MGRYQYLIRNWVGSYLLQRYLKVIDHLKLNTCNEQL